MVNEQVVVSSNIQSIGYDADQQQLSVRFKNGARYVYEGVPQEEFEAFLDAGSKGQYFAQNIKDVYPTRRA